MRFLEPRYRAPSVQTRAEGVLDERRISVARSTLRFPGSEGEAGAEWMPRRFAAKRGPALENLDAGASKRGLQRSRRHAFAICAWRQEGANGCEFGGRLRGGGFVEHEGSFEDRTAAFGIGRRAHTWTTRDHKRNSDQSGEALKIPFGGELRSDGGMKLRLEPSKSGLDGKLVLKGFATDRLG